MEIKLFIGGYCSQLKKSAKELFNITIKNSKEYIILFINYSNYDVPAGIVLNMFHLPDGRTICENLTIKSVNLGFGPAQKEIPKGYRSLILCNGRDYAIERIKAELPSINDWFENEFYLTAHSESENKYWLGSSHYSPGDPGL